MEWIISLAVMAVSSYFLKSSSRMISVAAMVSGMASAVALVVLFVAALGRMLSATEARAILFLLGILVIPYGIYFIERNRNWKLFRFLKENTTGNCRCLLHLLWFPVVSLLLRLLVIFLLARGLFYGEGLVMERIIVILLVFPETNALQKIRYRLAVYRRWKRRFLR